MIAIDFGTTNSSIALFGEGDNEPRIVRVEYADPDSFNASVMPSAVTLCKNPECELESTKVGNDAFRHYFTTSHDALFLQEMKLHFDTTTKQQPTLVQTREYVELREEEGSFLTPVRKVIKTGHV